MPGVMSLIAGLFAAHRINVRSADILTLEVAGDEPSVTPARPAQRGASRGAPRSRPNARAGAPPAACWTSSNCSAPPGDTLQFERMAVARALCVPPEPRADAKS